MVDWTRRDQIGPWRVEYMRYWDNFDCRGMKQDRSPVVLRVRLPERVGDCRETGPVVQVPVDIDMPTAAHKCCFWSGGPVRHCTAMLPSPVGLLVRSACFMAVRIGS